MNQKYQFLSAYLDIFIKLHLSSHFNYFHLLSLSSCNKLESNWSNSPSFCSSSWFFTSDLKLKSKEKMLIKTWHRRPRAQGSCCGYQRGKAPWERRTGRSRGPRWGHKPQMRLVTFYRLGIVKMPATSMEWAFSIRFRPLLLTSLKTLRDLEILPRSSNVQTKSQNQAPDMH